MKLIIFVKDQQIIQAQIISKEDPNQKAIILPQDITVSDVRLWSKGDYGETMESKEDGNST